VTCKRIFRTDVTQPDDQKFVHSVQYVNQLAKLGIIFASAHVPVGYLLTE
jgi:hypothetical protein